MEQGVMNLGAAILVAFFPGPAFPRQMASH